MQRFLRPLYRLGRGPAIAILAVACILCIVAALAVVTALLFTLNEYSILPGILLLLVGLFLFMHTREELQTHRLAQGTVIRVFEVPGEPPQYNIHYKTRQGQLTIVKTPFGGKMNSSVLLLYDPDQLSNVREYSFVSLWLPCTLTCWSGLFFIIAGLFLWLSR